MIWGKDLDWFWLDFLDFYIYIDILIYKYILSWRTGNWQRDKWRQTRTDTNLEKAWHRSTVLHTQLLFPFLYLPNTNNYDRPCVCVCCMYIEKRPGTVLQFYTLNCFFLQLWPVTSILKSITLDWSYSAGEEQWGFFPFIPIMKNVNLRK